VSPLQGLRPRMHRYPGRRFALPRADEFIALQADEWDNASSVQSDLRCLGRGVRRVPAQEPSAGMAARICPIGTSKRAAYGEEILPTLSAKLVVEFGRGFSARNLANRVRFTEGFSDAKILQALTAKLTWTHFALVIPIEDSFKREFHSEMCRIE